jgi:hypothetical protein
MKFHCCLTLYASMDMMNLLFSRSLCVGLREIGDGSFQSCSFCKVSVRWQQFMLWLTNQHSLLIFIAINMMKN